MSKLVIVLLIAAFAVVCINAAESPKNSVVFPQADFPDPNIKDPDYPADPGQPHKPGKTTTQKP